MVKNISKILKKFGFDQVIRNKRSSGNIIKKGGRNSDGRNKVDQGIQSMDNDIGSICINYDEGNRLGKKLKLHWDYEEGKFISLACITRLIHHSYYLNLCLSTHLKGVYKITKTSVQTRRIAIIDIVHGTSAPDIRFLLKTHKDEDIDPTNVELISELQKPPLELFDGTYFQSKHLKKRLRIDSIRQSIVKQKFV